MIPVIFHLGKKPRIARAWAMQWAMNYIVYDVRREGEAGSRPALGFGFGNFLKVGVN